jgi:hypothetical protein
MPDPDLRGAFGKKIDVPVLRHVYIELLSVLALSFA